MKQRARYKINFDSGWILASTALMGLAFFCQMVDFFVLHKPQDAVSMDLAFFLIVPAVFELIWIILLRCIKWNAAGICGITGTLFCVLLTVQNCFAGGTTYIILSVLAYLLAAGSLVMITGGFFPYKYIGMAYFGGLLIIRLIRSGVVGLLLQRNWTALTGAFPAVCILFAFMAFFGGISGVRIKK